MNNRLSLLSLCTVLLLNPVLISKCYAKNADESTDKLSIEVKRAIDENTRGKALSCFITDKGLIKDQDLSAAVEVFTNNSTKIKDAYPFVKDNRLCVSGLDFGKTYTLKLHKGINFIKKTQGTDKTLTTNTDSDTTFTTIDETSSVKIAKGLILPSNEKQKLVELETVNTDAVTLGVFKISNNSLPQAELFSLYSENPEKYDIRKLLFNHGKFLGAKTINFKNKKNEVELTAVDISEFVNKDKSGVYVLSVIKAKDDSNLTLDDFFTYDDNSLELSKLLFISNLGVTSYSGSNGIDVNVRSLTDASPVKGATVTLKSLANDVLDSKSTDSDGFVHFDKAICQGENGQSVATVTVVSNDDFFPLDLRASPLYFEEGSGISDNNDYKVFAYTNRTLLRPGETTVYQALVRNKDLSAASLKALKLFIRRPDYVIEREIPLSKAVENSFEYEYKLPENAQLGTWTFELGFDEKHLLSSTQLTVSAFTPSALSSSLKVKDVIDDGDIISVNTDYNYGAKAQDIGISGSYSILPDQHAVDAYKDYSFGIDEEALNNGNYTKFAQIDSGNTNQNGEFNFTFKASDENYPSKVKFDVYVLDPATGSSYLTKEAKVKYTSPLIGVKLSKADNKYTLNSILCLQDGKRLDGKASYTLLKRNISYQYAYVDGNWKFVKNEYTEPVDFGEFTFNKDKVSSIPLNLEDGLYTVELKNDKASTKYNFVKGYVSEDNDLTPEKILITQDKESYQKGDRVNLSFESEFEGYGTLIVGNSAIETKQSFKVNKGHNEVGFDSADIKDTGTYVLVTAYKGTASKFRTASRAVGLSYIKFKNDSRLLNINASVEDTVTPQSTLTVNLDVDNSDDNTYLRAYLVDEGILSINSQKSPDPFAFLTDKRAFSTKVNDMYAYVMKALSKDGQGYGSDEMLVGANAQILSNTTKSLLSLNSSRVQTKDGKATVSFDIPNFTGKARLMVVGWNKDRVGSYSKDITITSDAVTKLATPSYLHVGDAFDARVMFDDLKKDKKDVDFKVSCIGAIECALDKSVVLKNSKANERIQLTALSEGTGTILLKAKASNYTYEDSYEIKVLPNRGKVLESAIIPLKVKEQTTFKFKNTFKDGTKVKLSYGVMPAVSPKELGKVAFSSYKSNYFDTLSDLSTLLEYSDKYQDKSSNEYKTYQNKISSLIDYVNSTINNQGYVDYSLVNYEEGGYAAAYAYLVLNKAQEKGYNVNFNVQDKLLENIRRNANSDNESTAALCMYALTLSSDNQSSTLTFRFDHSKSKEINAYISYAKAFALYGDQKRQELAVLKAYELLNEAENIRISIDKANISNNKIINLIQALQEYEPLYITDTAYDSLCVLNEFLKLKGNTLDTKRLNQVYEIVSKENSYSYKTPAQRAMMMEMLVNENKNKLSFSEGSIQGNEITLVNDGESDTVLSASIYDVPEKYAISKDRQDITVNYFTTDGTELASPLTVNVNEDIIVLVKVHENKLSGKISVESLLPANMLYLRSIDANEASQRYPFLGELTDSYAIKITKGDSSIISASQNRTNDLAFAYILKGAYKGKSAPLALTVHNASFRTTSEVVFNEKNTIEVK